MVEGPGVPPVHVCLERNAQIYKGAIQLGGRKKPLRHLIGLSEKLASGSTTATSGKMLVALRDPFLTQEVEAARLKLFPYDETSGKSGLFT